MSKESDKARWDVCESCANTGRFELLKRLVLWNIAKNRHREWKNPLYLNDRIRSAAELCPGCKFVLEHTTLSQELEDE